MLQSKEKKKRKEKESKVSLSELQHFNRKMKTRYPAVLSWAGIFWAVERTDFLYKVLSESLKPIKGHGVFQCFLHYLAKLLRSPKKLCIHSQNFWDGNNMNFSAFANEHKASHKKAIVYWENAKFLWGTEYFNDKWKKKKTVIFNFSSHLIFFPSPCPLRDSVRDKMKCSLRP